MSETASVSLFIAFAAGFLSFVSPCVLPLLPSYVSFVTGLSVDQLTDAGGDSGARARVRRIVLVNSLLFILGFSSIFVVLGASATLAGQFLLSYQGILTKIAGVVIVLFGLYVMGLLNPRWLMRDRRVHLDHKPRGHLGSFLVGMAFAAGWTPCVGPILGAILLMAGTSDAVSHGVLLLSAYSLGLGAPFFVTALALNTFMARYAAFSRHMRTVSLVSGAFLIAVGVLIFVDAFTVFASFLTEHGIGWTIEL